MNYSFWHCEAKTKACSSTYKRLFYRLLSYISYCIAKIFIRTFDKLAFFGCNGAEGGELDMRRDKRYI